MQSYTVVLGSGNSADLPGGLFFILLASTGAVDIEFFRNRTSIGKVSGIEEGYRNKFDKKFDAVKITDVSAAANTVKVGIAQEGDADYNRAFGSVTVADGNINAVDVAALLAAVAGTRSPLTDLSGCTAASAVNSTVTAVAAIDNVAGVRIALVNLMVNAATGLAAMTLDGNDRIALSGTDQSLVCRDLLIPDGIAVGIRSTSAGANARIVYEVLP